MYPWDGKNVYFLGFMASGKSAIGREFSKMLGWPFYDTDDLVEQAAGKTISEIFEQDGEQAFRDLESRVVKSVSEKKHQVVSLGGGAIIRQDNWKYIIDSGITIGLMAPVSVLAERIARKSHRPLMYNLKGDELIKKIESLLKEREPFYIRAQYKFENTGLLTVHDFTQEIFNTIRDDI